MTKHTVKQADAQLRINDEARQAPYLTAVEYTLVNQTRLAGTVLLSASQDAATPNAATQDAATQDADRKKIVLCLHGYLDNSHSFIPMLQQLAVNEYTNRQVIALDFAGHGQSGHRSADAHYHPSDYTQDIVSLIEAQDWQDVILVGHSMGGMIGCSVAALLPERITQLILVETAGALTAESDTTVSQLRTSITSRINAAQKQPKQPSHYQAVLTARMQVSDISLAHADLIMRNNLRFATEQPSIKDACTWGTDSRLRTISTCRFLPEQVRNIVQHIIAPVTMLIGDAGFERVKEQANERIAWFNQLSIIETPGNHYLHMQYPQVLSDMITGLSDS